MEIMIVKMKLLWAGLFLGSVVSCSVKESRDGGPCWLYEDSGDRLPVSLSVWREGSVLVSEQVRSHTVFKMSVERDVLDLTAVSGNQFGTFSCGKYVLEDRFPVDSIYAYHKKLDCSGEWLRDTVRCHKQFASVHLSLDITPAHSWYPDSLRMESAWSGLDILSMEPILGYYSYQLHCGGTDVSFRILRQGDDGLNLYLVGVDGTITDQVPLGQIMKDAGYDWTEEDLSDVEVKLTEAGVNLAVVIEDWRSGGERNFDI